jgi:hypothetical protein
MLALGPATVPVLSKVQVYAPETRFTLELIPTRLPPTLAAITLPVVRILFDPKLAKNAATFALP